MNPRNTHRHTSPRCTASLKGSVSLRNSDIHSDDLFDDVDSDDCILKVVTILKTLGAEELPPRNTYDMVTHLSYRDIFFTELSIAVGDYTGFDLDAESPDEYLIEVGTILALGENLEGIDRASVLGVLDESVESLRSLIAEPAYIEVSDQVDFNVWLILPLTEAAVESDGLTDTLTQYLNTAISLHNELRNRPENRR